MVQPWLVLTLDFLIIVVIVANYPGRQGQVYAGVLSAIYVVLIVTGALAIARQLPFALALGVSRRSFYAGSALLSVVLAAVYGLGLTVLQLIERGTGGWGLNLHFFRVPYFLAGPWYLSWLTSFVGLALMLAWGMWFGIVYRRWNLAGLLTLIAVQALALLLVLLTITSDARLAQRRPLLHHADHRRADRPARRPDRGAAGRRVRHRAPRHRLTRASRA